MARKFDSATFLERVRRAFRTARVFWRAHAQRRMIERGIRRSDVAGVVDLGEVIEAYDTDSGRPSALIRGWIEGRTLHVVLALDEEEASAFVITAYEPDPEHFDSDLTSRTTRKRRGRG